MLSTQTRRRWKRRMSSLTGGLLGRRRRAASTERAAQQAHRPHHPAGAGTRGLLWRVMAHGTEPGNPHGLLLAWPRWEHLAHSMWPTRSIPGARYDVLRVRFVPYEGEDLTLPDATEIRGGMTIGELHCNNEALLDLVGKKHGNPYRAAREDLRSLARWISQPGVDIDVQAFFGITLLANAAARLGFSVRERPLTLRGRLDRMFMTGLLILYTVDGLTRVEKGTTTRSYPHEVWLSRRELLKRYGPRGTLALSRTALTTRLHSDQLTALAHRSR